MTKNTSDKFIEALNCLNRYLNLTNNKKGAMKTVKFYFI